MKRRPPVSTRTDTRIPSTPLFRSDHVHAVDLGRIELGSPDALDADGIVESVIIADDATLDGALVEDGVATFDVPRNVVITGAASVTSVTFTITGTDVFGEDRKSTRLNSSH